MSLSLTFVTSTAAEKTGREIYQELCVKCHGPNGEGVADKYDEPLFGERSVKSLTRLIDKTMPEDDPALCKGDDAAKVAEYVFNAFYSPQARAKTSPAKIDFVRLTARQYQNAVADLLGSFHEQPALGSEHGLRASYYNSRSFNGDKKAFDRVDQVFSYFFVAGSPDTNKVSVEEFSIRWRGSLIAEETGDYEFCLKTENGARLYVNDDKTPLIDEWVSSGREVREHKEAIHLLGGRAYPIQIDFFKFKEKSASIAVLWRAPHKSLEALPARNLVPVSSPETLVVTTPFPADDGSAGYERGNTVSKAWEQATTHAAIEVAGKIVERLDSLTSSKPDAKDRRAKIEKFSEQFVDRAFRRPLTADEKNFFVSSHFEAVPEPEKAVKRVVLLALKSPRFLYPELPDGQIDDFDIASRLSFTLWDSIPDAPLLRGASEGKLHSEADIAGQSARMLQDGRAKAKLRDFFHHWLKMEEAEDMSKDPSAFPEFTRSILGDLRTSLDLFVEDVLWSDNADYRRLLLDDYIYMNRRIAEFYGADTSPFFSPVELRPGTYETEAGIDQEYLRATRENTRVVDDQKFVKVKFSPKERTGVLTHPYLLSTFAYYKSSSPIHRGVFLTRNILGRALKPPPMAIKFMDGKFDPGMTMRQKVTELTSPNNCQGCHTIINPLGFSLENFDGVGRLRAMDNGKAVDTVSDYTTPEGETVHLTGARDVAEYAAGSEEGPKAFVRQLFQQLVKQGPSAYGPETLQHLRTSFQASGFNVQKLVVEIARVAALQGSGPNAIKITSAN